MILNSEIDNDEIESVRVRRAPFGALTVYDVSDNELNQLAKGQSASIYLNVAIAMLSTAISLFTSLLNIEVKPDFIERARVLTDVTIFATILGTIFLIIWYIKRKDVSELVSRIKNRLPPEGIPETNSIQNAND